MALSSTFLSSASTPLAVNGMASAKEGLRQRTVNGNGNSNGLQVSRVVVPTAEGKKKDEELDKHTEYVRAPYLHVCC